MHSTAVQPHASLPALGRLLIPAVDTICTSFTLSQLTGPSSLQHLMAAQVESANSVSGNLKTSVLLYDCILSLHVCVKRCEQLCHAV